MNLKVQSHFAESQIAESQFPNFILMNHKVTQNASASISIWNKIMEKINYLKISSIFIVRKKGAKAFAGRPVEATTESDVRQLRRNGAEYWPDVDCCCTTMHRRTCLELQSRTSELNSCLIYLTQQTWHPATSACFDIWRSIFVWFCDDDEFKQATESYLDSLSQRILFDWNEEPLWLMSETCWCEGRLCRKK